MSTLEEIKENFEKSNDDERPAVVAPTRCESRHPTLGNRCILPTGHEGGHGVDLGPNHPGARTEEFLRAKGIAFRELWRSKMKRGFKKPELEQLKDMVKAFHATEEP